MTDASQVDQMDISAAATAMAQRSAFIRTARQKAGKDQENLHDPQRGATSRVVDGKEPDTSRDVPSTPQPAAKEPAPSGGEPTATPTSAQEPRAAPVPQTIRVKVGDKELEMPVELLGSYIEKAQRADAMMEEAKTLQKVRATDDAIAITVADWAKTADPEQMKQLRAVLRGERQTKVHEDQDLMDEPQQRMPEMPESLKAQLMPYLQVTEQLLAREKARDAQVAEQGRQASVEDLMSKFEVFKQEPALKSMALRSIKNRIAADPEEDLTQVVAEHAAEYGNFHRERLSLKAAAGSKSAATPDPEDPGAASRPALNGKDLQKGGVLAAVQQFLRSQACR